MTEIQRFKREVSRRTVLCRLPAWAVLLSSTGMAGIAAAQQAATAAAAEPGPQPFSFDILTQMMHDRAKAPDPEPPPLDDFAAKLTYDEFQMIRFPPKNARWSGPDSTWRVIPFHIGWLFKAPVQLYQVESGQATEMTFSATDFTYGETLRAKLPENYVLPGVAGFKLNHPLNRPDIFDEVVSFLGASYFRALGQGNLYGLSARGLAVDTGMSVAEEFPRFSAFWLEKPGPDADEITLYAALDSASLTGAYRFVITPGIDTVVEVTARLNFRAAVKQLGIAPLTSMFLFAGVNRAAFDDYRPEVHDSDGLRIQREDGDVLWRALDNPRQLASSYFAEERPRRYGLRQRQRDFDAYEDPEAHYERRPSVDVEPIGDWGKGTIRLVEIPSDLEIHDNIVAFWVPEAEPKAGDTLEIAYRLHWGDLTPPDQRDLALVSSTSSGPGGVSGVENKTDSRKFVIDFQGGMLARLPADDATIKPVVTLSKGNAEVVTLSKVEGQDIWRLAMDISSQSGEVVELSAHVAGYGRKLTEIWMFQWVKP